MHSKEKLCKLNTIFWATELIFIFMPTSLQQKFMNKVIKIEILTIKYKAKKAIEKERGCKYIRINPDEQIFNIFETINTKIH